MALGENCDLDNDSVVTAVFEGNSFIRSRSKAPTGYNIFDLGLAMFQSLKLEIGLYNSLIFKQAISLWAVFTSMKNESLTSNLHTFLPSSFNNSWSTMPLAGLSV